MQVLVLMLLRVSAYWGSDYPCLKKALIFIYAICTMATASIQVVTISLVYRTYAQVTLSNPIN